MLDLITIPGELTAARYVFRGSGRDWCWREG